MKINLPINNFKLEGNKVFINDLVVEYDEISEDNKEILESLISKGAYGSALLTLNTLYNVKKINEAEYNAEDYLSYLGACNNLMKECVVEVKEARDFKPLVNLNGLEIMESTTNIARGKGDTLLIEDFRDGVLIDKKEELQEKFLRSAKYGSPVWHSYKVGDSEYEFKCQTWETRGGWGHNVILYSTSNYDTLADVDVRYYNRTWEMWEFQTAMEDACRKAMSSYPDLKEDLQKVYDMIQGGDRGKVSEMRRTSISEAEGTQCSDIAGKKDQSVGRLKKAKKPKKFIVKEALDVPRNHGFRGFMKNESGLYTRGNYVLIKEGKTIKAINKKSLENVITLNK